MSIIHSKGGMDLYQDNIDKEKFILSYPNEDFQKVVTSTQYIYLTSVLNSINFEKKEIENLDSKTVPNEDIEVQFKDLIRIYYNFDEEVKSLIWISDYKTAKEWNHDLLKNYVDYPEDLSHGKEFQ